MPPDAQPEGEELRTVPHAQPAEVELRTASLGARAPAREGHTHHPSQEEVPAYRPKAADSTRLVQRSEGTRSELRNAAVAWAVPVASHDS